MIVFASSLRHARRPRRIPSVASVVRALGTVRVSDRPDAWTPCTAQVPPRPAYGTVTRIHGGRAPGSVPHRTF